MGVVNSSKLGCDIILGVWSSGQGSSIFSPVASASAESMGVIFSCKHMCSCLTFTKSLRVHIKRLSLKYKVMRFMTVKLYSRDEILYAANWVYRISIRSYAHSCLS